MDTKQFRWKKQTSRVKQDRCPTTVLRKIRRHDSVKLIRLKQTDKLDTQVGAYDEKTAESIETADRDFATDLPLLVDETAGNTKILNAIATSENGQIDDIFHAYRQHGEHLLIDSACFLIMTRMSFQKR